MTEASRKILVALVVVGGLGGLALVVGLAAAWQVWVAPWRTLPREEAAIEADWQRVQDWLPKDLEPSVVRPEVIQWVEAAAAEGASGPAVEPFAAWIETDGSLGNPGCSLANGLAADSGPSRARTFDLFRAGKNLVAAGEVEQAAILARELRRGELIDLMVGQALATEANAVRPVGELRPVAGELFGALAHEAACTDLLMAGLIDGTLLAEEFFIQPNPVVSLDVERLRVRDFYSRLLMALHPVKDDRQAAREVLAQFDVPIEKSLVAALLVQGIPNVAGDYLRQLESFGP